MEKEKEIFNKISEIKEILNEKIKTFEDYKLNKTTMISLLEQIEIIINQISNNKENEALNNEEQKENSNLAINKDIKENNNNEKSEEKEIKKEEKINEENNEDINNEEEENNNQEEEEEIEKNSLPKLNFDYDKNINEILGNISIEQSRPFLKSSSGNDINDIIIKENENKEKEIPKEDNKRMSNLQNNGYTNLFSFNQELSNINNRSSFTTEDFTTKKNNKVRKEKENLNNNIINDNTNNSNQSEENIYKNNNNNSSQKENNEENENIKNSKALRVADIIMKINSNDILYDIITQIYSKEILEQLMSPDVDTNLINVIEQTIDKITILENEEIQKLRNKEASLSSDVNNNNENEKENDYNEIKEKDKYIYNELNKKNNINNYNKLNIPKKSNEYKKYKSSSSFYDKNKNTSINSVNSINYANYPPKKISSYKKNKSKEMHLNSEILQNYPKTGKTILGYEKFKRDKNREFNFERSLRNENYDDNYNNIYRRNYNLNNLNISKADSIKSHYSINGNRSYSNKRIIFNNQTSPFGDYFDSSLQKGGESKLYNPRKNNKGRFKNARSPVKDYIDGLNEVYV